MFTQTPQSRSVVFEGSLALARGMAKNLIRKWTKCGCACFIAKGLGFLQLRTIYQLNDSIALLIKRVWDFCNYNLTTKRLPYPAYLSC